MTRALVVGLLLVSCTSTPPAVATCTAPQSACGNECADLSLDDQHCGSCSTACDAASEACADGVCYPTSCTGMPCDPGSVCYQNLCTEKSCVGVLCPQGEVCKAGACTCESGRTSCNGNCVDVEL